MVENDVEKVGVENMIDLSIDAERKQFFSKGGDGYGEGVRGNFHVIKVAVDYNEVLFMWRGKMLGSAMTVCCELMGAHIVG